VGAEKINFEKSFSSRNWRGPRKRRSRVGKPTTNGRNWGQKSKNNYQKEKAEMNTKLESPLGAI
jgi:hypothetical protein